MREEKGITLISLISYVIVLLVVVSTITLITNFLIHNMKESEGDFASASEMNKFDVAFLQDIKKEDVSIYKIVEEGTSIILEDKKGNDIQYIFQENTIYRVENGGQRIKVNEDVENFKVSSEGNKIQITIKIKGYEAEKEYKLGK